jgi:hypothetical protein
MWQTELLKKFKDLNIEIVASKGQPDQNALELLLTGKIPPKPEPLYNIYMPKRPSATIQAQIEEVIPKSVKVEFIEGIKPATLNDLRFAMQENGIGVAEARSKDRHYIISAGTLPGRAVEEYDGLWARVNQILLDDGYLDTWEISCGDMKIFCNKRVILDGIKNSKIRDINILDEDITDLKIALGIKQDVNDFIAMLEGK